METTIEGGQRAFPDTTWGLLTRLGDSRDPRFRAGLELLCDRYWKPVYGYLRLARAKKIEDAKDLTQAFFLWLLGEEASLRKYSPRRGAFRAYLKALLRHFVSVQERDRHRLKRGGGIRILRLEDEEEPLKELLADRSLRDPEKAFDQAWALTLSERAIARVRERFVSSGKETLFRTFEKYALTTVKERPSYAELARELDLKEGEARTHVFQVRKAVRKEIMGELAKLTTGQQELQEEWDALFNSDP